MRSKCVEPSIIKKKLYEFDSDGTDLIMYYEVRWLSGEKCLKRFFDLLKDILLFVEIHVKNSEEMKKSLSDQNLPENIL